MSKTVTNTTTGIDSALAELTLSDQHVAACQRFGFNPNATASTVRGNIVGAMQGLKQLVSDMPPNDPNIDTINAMIATLS